MGSLDSVGGFDSFDSFDMGSPVHGPAVHEPAVHGIKRSGAQSCLLAGPSPTPSNAPSAPTAPLALAPAPAPAPSHATPPTALSSHSPSSRRWQVEVEYPILTTRQGGMNTPRRPTGFGLPGFEGVTPGRVFSGSAPIENEMGDRAQEAKATETEAIDCVGVKHVDGVNNLPSIQVSPVKDSHQDTLAAQATPPIPSASPKASEPHLSPDKQQVGARTVFGPFDDSLIGDCRPPSCGDVTDDSFDFAIEQLRPMTARKAHLDLEAGDRLRAAAASPSSRPTLRPSPLDQSTLLPKFPARSLHLLQSTHALTRVQPPWEESMDQPLKRIPASSSGQSLASIGEEGGVEPSMLLPSSPAKTKHLLRPEAMLQNESFNLVDGPSFAPADTTLDLGALMAKMAKPKRASGTEESFEDLLNGGADLDAGDVTMGPEILPASLRPRHLTSPSKHTPRAKANRMDPKHALGGNKVDSPKGKKSLPVITESKPLAPAGGRNQSAGPVAMPNASHKRIELGRPRLEPARIGTAPRASIKPAAPRAAASGLAPRARPSQPPSQVGQPAAQTKTAVQTNPPARPAAPPTAVGSRLGRPVRPVLPQPAAVDGSARSAPVRSAIGKREFGADATKAVNRAAIATARPAAPARKLSAQPPRAPSHPAPRTVKAMSTPASALTRPPVKKAPVPATSTSTSNLPRPTSRIPKPPSAPGKMSTSASMADVRARLDKLQARQTPRK